MLDLDGLKLLNDRFGHPAGDDLLREAAAALARAIRDQDIVARVGETSSACSRLRPTPPARSVWSPGRKHPWRGRGRGRRAGRERRRGGFPHDGTTADGLLHAADHRLLAAKSGRGRRRAAA